ncbi:MAG: hypothetical protein IIW08_09575, partial [Clostridia bacterium]|nr:hypothetical protein [Clostridia bacterium]
MNDKKKGLFKSFLIYAIIIGGIFLIVNLVGAPKNSVKKLSYSELLTWIDHDIRNEKKLDDADADKTVKSVIIVENTLVGITDKSAINEKNFSVKSYDLIATIPSQEQFYNDVNRIYEKYSGGEKVSPTDYFFTSSVQQPEGVSWWVELLPILIMVILFGGLMVFVMRAQTSGPNKGAN